MSKISYPQLVKNLANAYRVAVGSTEPIVVGELTAKVTEAMGSGVSVKYKSIIYNEDNTITLIDKDEVEHTISCVYKGNKLTTIAYDDKEIPLTYNGDTLISINNKEINLEYAPSFNVGESIVYKSIIYNDDNTITLIDTDNVEHTMVCSYEDGNITSIIYDDEAVELNYNNDDLIAVEDTMTNLNNVPIQKVDGVSIYSSLLKPTVVLSLGINTKAEVVESEE